MSVSIFNDVIGPVMRGPSSSHSAAANRIGLLARDLMGGRIDLVTVQFDRSGSLATTHASQGSDMGLCGGLLGWDCRDERLPTADRRIRESGIDVRIEIGDFGMAHPNTYRLLLSHHGENHSLTAISTGGGMIEVTDIDGFPTAFDGGAHETLIFPGGTDLAGRGMPGCRRGNPGPGRPRLDSGHHARETRCRAGGRDSRPFPGHLRPAALAGTPRTRTKRLGTALLDLC
jgi:iron-sulfur-dependent L-serine dehydratase beta subunit